MTGKVIALKGTNLPLEKLTNAGARIIENETGKARLIFDDDIKTICHYYRKRNYGFNDYKSRIRR